MRKLKRIHASKELSFYSIEGKVLDIPFYQSNVPAGFPSPAEDFMDLDLNLQEYLVQHPSATFCVKVTLKQLPKATLDFEYLIVNQNDELICTGHTKLAFLSPQSQRPMRCPDFLAEKFN